MQAYFPGHHRVQVNKIRELPGHSDVVVTHSDSKELYVWHTERQPSRPQALQVLPHVMLCLGRGAFPDNCAAADSGVDYKGYRILHPMSNSSSTPSGGPGVCRRCILMLRCRDRVTAALQNMLTF